MGRGLIACRAVGCPLVAAIDVFEQVFAKSTLVARANRLHTAVHNGGVPSHTHSALLAVIDCSTKVFTPSDLVTSHNAGVGERALNGHTVKRDMTKS